MSKNKIIFAILWAILFVLIVLLVLVLRSSTNPPVPTASSGDIRIWIYQDDPESFQNFLTSFKNDTGKYTGKVALIESFSDYSTYINTLSAAAARGELPDIFMLNNNEDTFLSELTLGIDPSFISPNDFRKAYRWVFSDDLVTTLEEDSSVEFLKGIPIWYQSLGIYFNRRFFKSEQFDTWSSLTSAIAEVAEKGNSIVPIGLGNNTVVSASDILMQLFLSLGSDSLTTTTANTIQQWLQTYLSFGDRRWDNAYNTISSAYSLEDNLDYFSRGDVVAVAGYPRMLASIAEKWYQKNFLLATAFPQYGTSDPVSLVDYNYFVQSTQNWHQDFTNDLFAYMVSEQWVKAYLQEFPFYLPASLSVEDDIREKKIYPDFNIVYKDFINREATLSSYDVGQKSVFESQVSSILSLDDNHTTLFERMRDFIVCSTSKSQTLSNLSSACR